MPDGAVPALYETFPEIENPLSHEAGLFQGGQVEAAHGAGAKCGSVGADENPPREIAQSGFVPRMELELRERCGWVRARSNG